MQVHAVTVRHVVVVHISLEELRRVPPVTGDRSAGTALPGGPYSPTTSSIFSAACGSVVNLNVVTRCGWSACAFQIRCTVVWDTPARQANSRVVQWVTPGAGARSVRATTCARCRAVSVGGRPARGRSCRPATPPSANRRRRRLAWTTVYPVRLATSTPDSPRRHQQPRPHAAAEPGPDRRGPLQPLQLMPVRFSFLGSRGPVTPAAQARRYSVSRAGHSPTEWR